MTNPRLSTISSSSKSSPGPKSDGDVGDGGVVGIGISVGEEGGSSPQTGTGGVPISITLAMRKNVDIAMLELWSP